VYLRVCRLTYPVCHAQARRPTKHASPAVSQCLAAPDKRTLSACNYEQQDLSAMPAATKETTYSACSYKQEYVTAP
jgi:hypothetical protein